MDSILPARSARQRLRRSIEIVGDATARVHLTRGLVAVIDEDSVAAVAGRDWFVMDDGRGHLYAVWDYCDKDGRTEHFYMHKVVMGVGGSQLIDHANGDTLDNRKRNLRPCTYSLNAANSTIKLGNSGLRGVWFDASRRKYVARITVNRRKITIGRFDDALSAGLAYDEAARQAFGRFARINFAEAA